MTNAKLDYKKEYKDLYMPKAKPSIVEVPPIRFIMVDGKGNPNDEGGEYQQAVELLYALTYTIKMSKMGANKPDGYFEYVVSPLERLWWLNDNSHFDFTIKEKFCWTSMIRQPEFVTQGVFDWACKEVAKKKPLLDTSKARLQIYHEGLCVQMMHIGPYDNEPETTAQMDAFMKENNLQNAIDEVQPDGTIKKHHEIYLGDPRKIEPSKRKTVLRHPVKR
jgi:hypothetical protein